MSMAEMERLQQSVLDLKTSNRQFRGIFSALLVFAISLTIMGQAGGKKTSTVLEAEKFVLRDTAGVVRGVLTVETEKGTAALTLADKTGKALVELSARDDGQVGLVFADRTGKTRAALGVKGDNSPDFGLADANGILRITMGIDANKNPAIVLYDERHNPIWKPIWRKP